MVSVIRHAACLLLVAPSAAQAADAGGGLILDMRLRYEAVEQDNLEDAEALTLRTRLGYETPAWRGLRALAEAENVTALVDDYSTGAAATGQAVIADPGATEINRAQVSWTGARAAAVLGRQGAPVDNPRFVGNVGFRQNEQTFDAVQVSLKPATGLSLTYAYLERIHRVLGDDHPQGEWDSDTHLAQVDWHSPAGRLTTFAYLMAFENAPAQSNASFGVQLTGARPIRERLSATYRAEYARQSDYRNSPVPFDLDYLALGGGLTGSKAWTSVTVERLDGDGRRGFTTPLATLHAYQGWTDVFAMTPPGGVRDINLRAGMTVKPFGDTPVRLQAAVHDFADANADVRFGRELDLLAAVPLTTRLGTEFKAAIFDGDHPSFPDRTKVWMTLELKY